MRHRGLRCKTLLGRWVWIIIRISCDVCRGIKQKKWPHIFDGTSQTIRIFWTVVQLESVWHLSHETSTRCLSLAEPQRHELKRKSFHKLTFFHFPSRGELIGWELQRLVCQWEWKKSLFLLLSSCLNTVKCVCLDRHPTNSTLCDVTKGASARFASPETLFGPLTKREGKSCGLYWKTKQMLLLEIFS